MRATVMYGAGDVRVENRPDPKIQQPADAIVRIVLSCVCGSDLWPYASMPATGTGRPMGHEFLGVDYAASCPGATIGQGLAVRGEEVAGARAAIDSWLRRTGLR
ncbi:hypothetical protein [Nonomuraea insulae]|uniref:Alcohol dehydrogenase-like protein n=1 Tax=Nonomuraea insulae TaxID=1616787 RepID=A0ABW1D9Q6_9ACTN